MPVKEAAKKAPVKHVDPQHHERKDLRRAYEHLGRVEILSRSMGEKATDVSTLVAIAEKELGQGNRKDAADLLRAAEHFSFAAIGATGAKSSKVSPELKEVVTEGYHHLIEHARDRWKDDEATEHHTTISAIWQSSIEAAEKALRAGAYRQALELARGAEALAHVRTQSPKRMATDAKKHMKLLPA